jgi:dimethylhistidine N-methyltransferase
VNGPKAIGEQVARGLTGSRKTLPAHLFYDERGSALFEQITALPEYYLTRAESSIFEEQGDAIVADVLRFASGPVDVLEIGAGLAAKTQILLRAIVRRQSACAYFAADLCGPALEAAKARLEREEPSVRVVALNDAHEVALAQSSDRGSDAPLLALFLGSSIGNYDDEDAVKLLRAVRAAIGRRGALLLGTDLVKNPEVLRAAYDDASGVTAAFNKNILARLNRELDADFVLDRFRHVASWNEAARRIEMHLESAVDQTVPIRALGLNVRLSVGERIHTESCHKYDEARVDVLLQRAGLRRARSYLDRGKLFAAHLATVR